MGWNRALHKDSFSSSEKWLFRTCLDCFQSTQNPHVDRTGNLKHCFPITWCKQTPFWASNLRPSSPKPKLWPLCYRTLASRGFCLLILFLRWLQGAGVWPGLRDLKNCFFGTVPCEPQKWDAALLSLSPNQMIRQARLCKNTIFQALKNCFCPLKGSSQALRKKHFFATSKIVFSALPVWNSVTSPALQKKKSGSKKLFFRMSLVKSANSTSLPRLSSLQIKQVHTIHN